MRKRQTFLLTIISSDTEDASFCGRIKTISSGKTRTFTCLEDLHNLINQEMDNDEIIAQLDNRGLARDYPKKNFSSSTG